MKKKMIALMTTLAVASTATVTAFAVPNEGTVINPTTDPKTGSTAVLFDSGDEYYEVIIPAQVVLSTTAEQEVSVVAQNVRLRQPANGAKFIQVSVSQNNDFNVYNGSDSFEYSVRLKNSENALAAGSVVLGFDHDDHQEIVFGTVDMDDVHAAGNYTGNLTFDITTQVLR